MCQLQGCDFDEKEVRERVCFFFDRKCKRKSVFLSRECITWQKNLDNFRHYAPFFRNFVHKRVHFGKTCKKNSMFFTEKLHEEGCPFFFQKNCKRKGTVSETVLAHPHTKIKQVPPPGIYVTGTQHSYYS